MTNLEKGLQAIHKGDFVTALRELQPLAEQGDAEVQNQLGEMYEFNKVGANDNKESMKWYKMAAEQGHAAAQNHLALMYRGGHGVTKNYKEAVKWFKLSAEQGFSSGQANLGSMYENGEGVPQDYVLAHMWFNLAISQGDGVDEFERDDIAKKMTREQIAEAQKLARDWMAKKTNN